MKEWETFDLKPGGNLAVYRVPSLDVEIRFIVYLIKQDAKIVFTDVDGTITVSDVVGKVGGGHGKKECLENIQPVLPFFSFSRQVYPYFGVDADHAGVVELYDKIAKNGYQIIYLTARSMGDDKDTREYLFKVNKVGKVE